jgi:hypothetical protein
MAFDFLTDKEDFNQNKTTSGGRFKSGKNVFIDKYQSHLDAHNIFGIPFERKYFRLKANFDFIKGYYADNNIKGRIGRNFYGPKTKLAQLKEGYTQFQKPELLDEALNKLKVNINDDLFSGLDKPKVNFNDKFGIFSFDLASMMMTYVFEYYTKNGDKVDSNYVEKNKNGQFVFTPNGQIVDQVIKRREDGTPVVVSQVNNSYIDFEKQEKEQRSVEIMVNVSFAGVEGAEKVIYNSLAGITVAENLLKKGFKVKLTGLFSIQYKGTHYFHIIPVKRFNQPLDKNAAAYVLGDPRFFRYEIFKLIAHGIDQSGIKVPETFGIIETNLDLISRRIEKNYVPNSQRKQADSRLYFGGSRDMTDVKNEVDKALDILNENYGNEKATA